MIYFSQIRQLIKEAVEADSEVPGMSITLANYLQHLSSPVTSEKTIKKTGEINEVTVLNNKNPHASRLAKMPKTQSMIDKTKAELPNENLHRRLATGFSKAMSDMENEDHATRKAKLKESKAVLEGYAKSRGLKAAPALLGENGKTKKSSGIGVHTLGLALAPHTAAGLDNFDVCPRASSECRKNCLGTEAGGNRQYPDMALSSKAFRTHFLVQHPEHAARLLHDEIGRHEKRAIKNGMVPAIRLNVTSDINFHQFAPKLATDHLHTDFYDYTKVHNKVMKQSDPTHPKNVKYALSHTGTGHPESNDHHAVKALEHGHVVAMVYHRGKNVPNPTHVEDVKTGKRYPVINGDEDDHIGDRHAQAGLTPGKPGHGVVSGLRLKGVKNEDAGHFANAVDPDGIIRINH